MHRECFDVQSPVLYKVDEVTINKIKNDLLEDCNSKLIGGRLIMNSAAIIIAAEK
jgi:hypothetical protein